MIRLPRGESAVSAAVVAERIWYGLLALAAAAVVFVAIVVAASASPATCNTCHAVQAKALAKSESHSGIPCASCHAGATTSQLISSRLDVVGMIGAQLLPTRPRVAAQVDNRRCLICHGKDLDGTVTRDALKMQHRQPLEAGFKCQTCHPQTAHGQASMRRMGYTMDMCLACHNSNPKNISTCDVCHTDPSGKTAKDPRVATPWRVTHGPDWKRMHGMGDLKSCKACHEQSFCVQCHKIDVPHRDGYIRVHGSEVLARANGRSDCLVCHKAASCDNCHRGLQMPHPDGFAKTHSSRVKKSGDTACLGCHAKSSCEQCHARHTHPGLSPDTIKQLRSRPVTVP